MEKLYNQVQIYLNMDEEIEFNEFQDFYKTVISELNERGQELEEDDIWRALFIAESLTSNAKNRIKETKNKQEKKKYKKMGQRSKLWAEHFTLRLHQSGYNEKQINERFEQMLEEEPEASS
nr:hypothetical protein [Salsuginibacillus kocurii]